MLAEIGLDKCGWPLNWTSLDIANSIVSFGDGSELWFRVVDIDQGFSIFPLIQIEYGVDIAILQTIWNVADPRLINSVQKLIETTIVLDGK